LLKLKRSETSLAAACWTPPLTLTKTLSGLRPAPRVWAKAGEVMARVVVTRIAARSRIN
jgi:hypothetical protein